MVLGAAARTPALAHDLAMGMQLLVTSKSPCFSRISGTVETSALLPAHCQRAVTVDNSSAHTAETQPLHQVVLLIARLGRGPPIEPPPAWSP